MARALVPSGVSSDALIREENGKRQVQGGLPRMYDTEPRTT
jgi:hypothetical protein